MTFHTGNSSKSWIGLGKVVKQRDEIYRKVQQRSELAKVEAGSKCTVIRDFCEITACVVKNECKRSQSYHMDSQW